MRPPLRSAAATLGLLLAACGGGAGGGPRNLLLVVLDTTRADHLSCYGYPRETSPTIDGLAAAGLICEEAYASSSLTPVSAGALLTGTHPYRHGIRSLFVVDGEALSPNAATLAQLFGRRGFRTAGFVSAAPMSRRYGLDRGFDEYTLEREVHGHVARLQGLKAGNAYQRRADETTDRALAWLDEHGDEPFTLLLHWFDAHDGALVPPRAFLEEHTDLELPADFGQVGHLAFLEDPVDRVDLYDAEIRYMDAELARVLAKLDELGVRDDTVICIVGDHGEGLGDHGFWTHGLVWNEQLRVPLVLSGPGVEPGRLDARVRLVDVLPTLAELFDLGLGDAGLDGSSFLGIAAEEDPREVYAEVHHAPGDRLARDPEIYTLVAGRWKYVHRPSAPGGPAHELYDLEADPGELANLWREDHPVARWLEGRLVERGAISGGGASTEGLDEAFLQGLRDLGYF